MNPYLVLLPSLSLLAGPGPAVHRRSHKGRPLGHTKSSAVPIEVNLACVAQTFPSAAETFKPQSPDLLELMIYHVALKTC